ncbi:MAG: hypothetical protein ACTSQO_03490 [Candidatus Helarchaeota archaeon]
MEDDKMKCTYILPDIFSKLSLIQRGVDENTFMAHDPEKVDYVRLKVYYKGKFGFGIFYLIINFDGTLEIQYKDTDYGDVLIKALANTLVLGDETDGILEKSFEDKVSIPLNAWTFIQSATNAVKNIKEK